MQTISVAREHEEDEEPGMPTYSVCVFTPNHEWQGPLPHVEVKDSHGRVRDRRYAFVTLSIETEGRDIQIEKWQGVDIRNDLFDEFMTALGNSKKFQRLHAEASQDD